jgi:hypothetical protein
LELLRDDKVVNLLMHSHHRGFAVVFAEDVPEVSTTDVVTGTSQHYLSVYLNAHEYVIALSRPMEGPLPGVQ